MNELLLQSAVRAHQAGNFAEAARLYGEILRANPRHFQALYALGFLYYQTGRFEEANRIIGDALRVNPRSPDAFFTRGCALQRLNRPAEALVCFDAALGLSPAAWPLWRSTATNRRWRASISHSRSIPPMPWRGTIAVACCRISAVMRRR
jgi:tetratricopeptide (TPR) repeat protein